jgi:hypothetical protein
VLENEEDEILRASHQGETPDPEDRDDRAEHEYERRRAAAAG